MDVVKILKSNLTRFPYGVGAVVAKIPFSMRPGMGKGYRRALRDIEGFEERSATCKKDFVFLRVKSIAEYAFKSTRFYKELYTDAKVDPAKLSCFDDLTRLPIVTKKMLQLVPLADRSSKAFGRSMANTGGSSGQPLEFYIQPTAIAHEWAHMHNAWKQIDFKYSSLKVMFVGRSTVKNVVDYDSARHSLVVDIYKGWDVVADALYPKVLKYGPQYLHGYPSAIFDFIDWLERSNHSLLALFKRDLKGIILSSEMPNMLLRERIEKTVECQSLSFYGHTERCILASEMGEKCLFKVYQTYGFAEAVELGPDVHLVGTSYYNYASPLIRYDTGDLVEPRMSAGLLDGFQISAGREGEFVIDGKGGKVFLTALIFGRHHEVFNYATHVQVHQDRPGSAILLVTSRKELSENDARLLFDLSNVDLVFSIHVLDEPIVTVSGKVPLLVKSYAPEG